MLADDELASLLGRGDAAHGHSLLVAMKEIRALDVDGSGAIDEEEFGRLLWADVLFAAADRAALKVFVDMTWEDMPKGGDGAVDRMACWDMLLADEELAEYLGKLV